MTLKYIKSISRATTLFLFGGMLMFSSCTVENNVEPQEYAKLVKTANVSEISSVKQKQFPGVIEEAEEVNLAFRVAGPIQKIYIKEGDYVKKGQLVAQMDTRDYTVQKNAIEAQVTQLQSEYERVAELNSRKSVADNDFEKMKAGKEMAEAKLKNALDQLNDTKLYAPFSGYITKVNFEDGELVNHGTPIATMIDVSSLKVEIDVPASLYINKNNITQVDCTQENIKGVKFPLSIYAHNIKANNNGLYKLYLHHKPAKGSKLAPGMNVSVTVNYTDKESSLLKIPATAIFEKNNESFVWIIRDGKVNARKITTGNMIKNGELGITEGLRAGEVVVVGGLNLLTENEEVRVVAEKSETNIGDIL